MRHTSRGTFRTAHFARPDDTSLFIPLFSASTSPHCASAFHTKTLALEGIVSLQTRSLVAHHHFEGSSIYHAVTIMSASLFSTLPPELICQVFESADNFSEVTALAQTARIFYYTWRENATSICKAVAPRVLWNLTTAERLLDMQEEAEAASQSQEGREEKSYIRAKRLLFNARCASAAGDNWVDLCQIHECSYREEDPYMRPSELARFEHAFYCVWTIGVMRRTPHLQDQALTFLDECSPQELCRLSELAEWAINYNHNDFGPPSFDLEDEVWKAGCDLVLERWYAYRRKGGPRAAPSAKDVPLGFFAFFDHTQRYLDLLRDE